MIKNIPIGLAVVLIVFLVVVALQSPEYRVVRSATISAPPPIVFAQVNDFHNWEAWSPWAKLDPTMKQTHEGPPSGTGAIYSWVGNSKVGEGRMTLTESRPTDLVRIKLEFLKPFASTANTEFTFKPEENRTGVTWSMSGQKNLLSKAFCLFMSMDKIIGKDFEKGLAALKSVSESKLPK